MPGVHARICKCLGQNPVENWKGRLDWGKHLTNVKLGEKIILFPRD